MVALVKAQCRSLYLSFGVLVVQTVVIKTGGIDRVTHSQFGVQSAIRASKTECVLNYGTGIGTGWTLRLQSCKRKSAYHDGEQIFKRRAHIQLLILLSTCQN